MWRTMFYPKNVPNWERAIRLALAVALIGLAALDMGTPVRGLLLGASGVFLAATAFVGFCPMCALVGRKIKHQAQNNG